MDPVYFRCAKLSLLHYATNIDSQFSCLNVRKTILIKCESERIFVQHIDFLLLPAFHVRAAQLWLTLFFRTCDKTCAKANSHGNNSCEWGAPFLCMQINDSMCPEMDNCYQDRYPHKICYPVNLPFRNSTENVLLLYVPMVSNRNNICGARVFKIPFGKRQRGRYMHFKNLIFRSPFFKPMRL